MAGKRDKPVDIVLMLWQIEVLHGQGMAISGTVRQIGLNDPGAGARVMFRTECSASCQYRCQVLE